MAHMGYVFGIRDNLEFAAADEVSAADGAEPQPAPAEPDEAASGKPPGAPAQKLSAWQRLILERTPLNESDRLQGAIDAAWFRRTHKLLGDKRWQALAAAARFAANPSQAKHAKFIAEVLLNKVPRQDLIDGIEKRQLKEHVRLLGLLPLATGKKRAADLRLRCQVLREYRRYANQLSGLTKPAAMLAWSIGMKNLAQSAGYADPQRLEWAVGAEAVERFGERPRINKQGGRHRDARARRHGAA